MLVLVLVPNVQWPRALTASGRECGSRRWSSKFQRGLIGQTHHVWSSGGQHVR